MFALDFERKPGLRYAQAHGARIFAAFRMLELGRYLREGMSPWELEFLLVDAANAYCAAVALVPPAVVS